MRRAPRPTCLLLAGALVAAAVGCASSGRSDAELRKRQARSHYDLAIDHLQKGHVELGLRELLAAQRLDPRDPKIHSSLGLTYYQKGRVAEGERHLRRALELRPDLHEARFNLAVLLLRERRWAECIAEAKRLVDDPTFVAPWRALTTQGWCEYKAGHVEEARRLLELSRDYDDGDWPTLLNLGILEAEQGNRRQAIGFFERVLKLRPGANAEAEANYRLGELYVALGERERAVSHLKAARERSPSGPWGRKSDAYLRRLR